MKTKVNFRTDSDSFAGGDQNGKGKRLVPEKKEKNVKRVLYQEIEEDEEIEYFKFKRNVDSIEDYYDDDDEKYLDGEDFDEDFDDDED
ncbi:MAG: hypothetical protein LBL90_06450 [Prevotellaceae bacterium]|jgi:hypothetical protein|nr:hypothetical protein [Prevotellaceae bacterium]